MVLLPLVVSLKEKQVRQRWRRRVEGEVSNRQGRRLFIRPYDKYEVLPTIALVKVMVNQRWGRSL